MFNSPLRHHPAIAFGIFVLFVAVGLAEALVYRRRGRAYDWRGARLSLTVSFVQRIIGAGTLLALAPLYAWLWSHRLMTLPFSGVAGLVIAFVAVEFAYYWMHRASHRIGWMWATHSVHHSAEELNFFAAIRLGATGFITFEWVPFAALILLLGIPPITVTGLFALDLLYQFFLHSDVLPRIDTHQWLLNTPSDHRVHHAVNGPYIDRNFGGMLIVFDRLFGTYAAERDDERPRYGLAGESRAGNAVSVLFGGWATLYNRLRDASGIGNRLRVVFGPP